MMSVEDEILPDRNILDVILILDCTGGMGDWIDELKATLQSFITKLEKLVNSQCKFGVVAYRDINDRKRFEQSQLANDHNSTIKFLTSLQCFGGSDAPEDLLGALERGLSPEYTCSNAKSRVYILITDAPCHGFQYHNNKYDDFGD